MNSLIFSIEVIPFILISVSAIMILIITVLCLAPMRLTAKYKPHKIEDDDTADNEMLPAISVIVYSHNRAEHITKYLDVLTSQHYPRYEIIVVSDSGKDDNTSEVVENYAVSHNTNRDIDIYCTFLPLQSFNLSRRKMALTLGMKAAKGDVVLTTSADCLPQSDYWLASMGQHFLDEKTEIVAGYSHTEFSEMTGIGKWYRTFDTLCSASLWIGYALNGNSYRADGLNLAFRKKLFFDNKGYADTAYLQDGDDDLFFSSISTRQNTKIEISHTSQLIRHWNGSEHILWRDLKERYCFTSRYLHTSAFAVTRLYHTLIWLVPICVTIGIALNTSSLVTWIIGMLILLSLWGYQICVYRRAAKQLQSVKLWWSVPIFALFRPISNFIYNRKFNSRKADNFTWSSHSGKR